MSEPAPEHAVASTGLTKRFGKRNAVDGIDLAVPAGAVYGFLGPNGSGKTTTIRMLLGLIMPTAGTATVLGHMVPDQVILALPRVGAMVEGPAMHGHLSGRANLGRLDMADATADPRTRKQRIGEALERVGLQAAAHKKFKAYSMGMRQRLGIAAALMRPHDLLVLDEPTNGLDPQGTREMRRLVTSLADDGSTVLVSSHLLSEVEQMCTHIGVMSHGRLVAQDSLEGLQSKATGQVRLETPDPDLARGVFAASGLVGIQVDGHEVRADAGEVAPDDLVRALVAADVRVRSFTTTGHRLEDLFVELTGEGFNVD
ncbi:ABC transporter ATP-binding protein [Propionibacteriaceae bacterium G1746]|uniref:ABC transporter ATP-binding protein n=1 Tax=Aestuariimicrobium sp. G57 TaxID=3418485 RepID=UPI003C260B9A